MSLSSPSTPTNIQPPAIPRLFLQKLTNPSLHASLLHAFLAASQSNTSRLTILLLLGVPNQSNLNALCSLYPFLASCVGHNHHHHHHHHHQQLPPSLRVKDLSALYLTALREGRLSASQGLGEDDVVVGAEVMAAFAHPRSVEVQRGGIEECLGDGNDEGWRRERFGAALERIERFRVEGVRGVLAGGL